MARTRLLLPYATLALIAAVVVASNRNAPKPRRAIAPTRCPNCGMSVNDPDAPTADLGNGVVRFCSTSCRDAALDNARDSNPPSRTQRVRDIVCHMDVNTAWGHVATYQGHTYYFCTDRCRRAFLADPGHYVTEKCLVCLRPLTAATTFPATYMGKTYRLCSAAHRAAFKRDPAAYFMHRMWGIPSWLYYGSIAIVLVVSFGVFELVSRHTDRQSADAPTGGPQRGAASRPLISGQDARHSRARAYGIPGHGSADIALPVLAAHPAPAAMHPAPRSPGRMDRFDLLSVGWVSRCLRSRVFRFALQAVVAVLFVVIIIAGLFGNQNPSLNIAPMLTWTVWWGLLIVLILFAGKAWCYVCPWDAIAGWSERLSFWKKKEDGLTLGLKWPRLVRNIWIATFMFVGLTWIELGFGVTMKPRVTAYLAIAMLLMAVVSAMVFDRKSFCRYGCLVGRVSGLYALFASTEVRSKDAAVCKACHGKECVTGSDSAYGCPTFLYPGKLESNTYCIQCMECIQACPHDNLAVNLRPWAADLVATGKPRSDEAYLALLMLAITGFHGLTMTPMWKRLIDWIRLSLGVGRVPAFTMGMTLLMLAPIAVYAILVAVSRWMSRSPAATPLSYHDYFVRYAYALLPIALFYHLAHNAEHLLIEGPKVAAMISDPLGRGWNLLGTAHWSIPPMISLDKLWLVQAGLVLVGHVYSLWVAQRTSLRLFGSARAAWRSQLPMLAGMIAFSVFSLWLLKQPMEMRTSAM